MYFASAHALLAHFATFLPIAATAFVLACDKDVALIAADSRAVRNDGSVSSNSAQKIQHVAPGIFAFGGNFVPAAKLALQLLREVAAEDAAAGLDEIFEEVSRQLLPRLIPILEQMPFRSGGYKVVTSFGAIGRVGSGKLCWITHGISSHAIKTQDPREILRDHSFDHSYPLTYYISSGNERTVALGLDPTTWGEGGLKAIERIYALEYRENPKSGGDVVIGTIDARGTRWLQPPGAPDALRGAA